MTSLATPLLCSPHRAQLSPARMTLALAPLLFVPLFWSPETWTLNILYLIGIPFTADGFAIHLNVVVSIYGFWIFLAARGLDRSLVRYLFFKAAWLTICLALGLATEPGWPNVMFFFQTVLPLFSICAGYAAATQLSNLRELMDYCILASTTFILLLWVYVITELGLFGWMSNRLGVIGELSLVIPQFRNYYPACVVIATNLALARYLFGRRRTSALVPLAIHVSFLPLCWSRSALFGITISIAVQFVMVLIVGRGLQASRAVLLMLVCLLFGTGLFACLGATVAERFDERDAAQLDESDGRRWTYFCEGLERSWERPLFGDLFIPCWEATPYGAEYETKRLFLAHNQYVDLLLRGGYPLLVAFLLLIGGAARRCLTLSRLAAQRQHSAALVFAVALLASLAALMVGANFQLYFIQAQTAVPFFFFVGAIYRACPSRMRVATAGLRLMPHPGHLPALNSATGSAR